MASITRHTLPTATIIAVALACYAQTLDYPFQFDAVGFFADKTFPHELKAPIRSLWNSAAVWSFNASRFVAFESFYLNYLANGVNPWGYHVVNLAIHIVNALLVYCFVALLGTIMARRGTRGTTAAWPEPFVAWFTALLFAAHPIQTQAVTYIWQRQTSLAFTFYLLSLVLYLLWSSKLENGWRGMRVWPLLAAGLLAGALAMLTKQIAFTLPVAVGLAEWFFVSGSLARLRKNIARPAAWLPLVAIIPGLTLLGLNREMVDIDSRSDNILSPFEYLLTQFKVIVMYLRLLVWPVGQNVDYDISPARTFFEVAPAFAVLLALVVLAVWLFRINRASSFGVMFGFLTLSVESSLFALEDLAFEHRMYLPTAGFFLAFTVLVFQAANGWLRGSVVFGLLAALVAVPMAMATIKRNEVWQDQQSLWHDVLEKSPAKTRSYSHLGILATERGDYDEALRMFQRGLAAKPDAMALKFFTGLVQERRGQLREAKAWFNKVLRLNPKHFGARMALAQLHTEQERYRRAKNEFEAALRIKPRSLRGHLALARLLERMGKEKEAVDEYRQVLTIKPNHVEANRRMRQWHEARGEGEK